MHPSLQILDLRHTPSRRLDLLFEEEARFWLEELHWDYRSSQQLIRRFIDSHSLYGFAVQSGGEPAGYGFYVVEEQKGLLGGLFVSPRFPDSAVTSALLREIVAAIRATPRLRRIEAQLVPFGNDFNPALNTCGFHLYDRQFMLTKLGAFRGPALPLSPAFRLETWNDRFFEPSARLIQLAYANHVDSEINDQYQSESGALRFLKNIIILPGCGQFLPEASFVVRSPVEDRVVAMVLNSMVSWGVAHTTQICVMPGYQRNGLARRLLAASVNALREMNYHALSLSVTSRNLRAVGLYEKLGFETMKMFTAAVWRE